MYGCDLFGYDAMAELCTSPNPKGLIAALFFVTFVIISSLGLLTLFVSVITTSMDEAKVMSVLLNETTLAISANNINSSAKTSIGEDMRR
jgi:voltage-gated sodium channel